MENKIDEVKSKVTHNVINEILAKFIGGKYWAGIKVNNRLTKKVLVNISELDMRKELGYEFEYSFISDYNAIMPIMNKIILMGYMIIMDDCSMKIYQKNDNHEKKIIARISLRIGSSITCNTFYFAAYQFVKWYNETKIK